MRKEHLLLALASISPSLSNVASASPIVEKQKPNVLFILVDDLGWNDLSCMGSTFYETPNVDQIARNGVRFTQGYAGCMVSSPSRASILTGKTPARHGITSWIGDPSGMEWRSKKRFDKLMPADYRQDMRRSEYTLADAYSDAGYNTYFVGKWHLGDNVGPTDFGFDVNIGGWAAGGPKGGYFSPYNNPVLEDGPRGENLSLRLSEEAKSQIAIAKKEDKPFFTFLSFYAVHAPIETTKERWEYYRQKAISQGLQPEGFEMERRMPVRSKQDNPIYAGLVEQMDIAVGNVIDYLRQEDLLDNTIIVFTSDNGGVVSGDNFATSLKPLRGGKGTQWEGGIRVPFLIWDGRQAPTNHIVAEPVISMDLYPTLLSMSDIKPNKKQKLDGVDLSPIFNKNTDFDRSLFWHFPHYGNQGGEPSTIVRDGDWKLIFYHEDERLELYNIANDISETTDLAEVNPEVVEKLKKQMNKFLKDTDASMPKVDPTYNAELSAKAKLDRRSKSKKSQESTRTKQYDEFWQPNVNWWESE